MLLPAFEGVFVNLLNSKVYNSGEEISYFASAPKPLMHTDQLMNWAVDINTGPNEISRYWVSPLLTLLLVSLLIAIIFAVVMTTLLPRKIGYLRQKIEREIANSIEFLDGKLNSSNNFDSIDEISTSLRNASLAEIHTLSRQWNQDFDDLRILSNALKWQQSGFAYKLLHINDALKVYMRFHFTEKFSNAVLGFVYIGAAVLIIIIGLRGLKFIPPTQPSLVLFALSLEFSLLITYAITLMYSKQESERNKQESAESPEQAYLPSDFGSHKDVEKLLRVFIKKNKKK
jgi:hypothetical protein